MDNKIYARNVLMASFFKLEHLFEDASQIWEDISKLEGNFSKEDVVAMCCAIDNAELKIANASALVRQILERELLGNEN